MTDKLELDIPVLLPEVPDAADACVGRLVSTLSAKPGVDRAHVVAAEGAAPAKLCVHFDPTSLPMPRVREMVRAAGAEIGERYGHAVWQVTGINHERRARTVGETLCAIPGVLQADASAAGTLRVEFDRERVSEGKIVDALKGLGLSRSKQVAPDDHAGHDHGPGGHVGVLADAA